MRVEGEIEIDISSQRHVAVRDATMSLWHRRKESVAVVRNDATSIEDKPMVAAPKLSTMDGVISREADEVVRGGVTRVFDGDGSHNSGQCSSHSIALSNVILRHARYWAQRRAENNAVRASQGLSAEHRLNVCLVSYR